MMPCRFQLHVYRSPLWAAGLLFLSTQSVLAAGTNMPWEQPLQQILDSIQGPVAKIIAVLVSSSPACRSPSEKPPAAFGA